MAVRHARVVAREDSSALELRQRVDEFRTWQLQHALQPHIRREHPVGLARLIDARAETPENALILGESQYAVPQPPQRRIGPLEVVDLDDERLLLADRREQVEYGLAHLASTHVGRFFST